MDLENLNNQNGKINNNNEENHKFDKKYNSDLVIETKNFDSLNARLESEENYIDEDEVL